MITIGLDLSLTHSAVTILDNGKVLDTKVIKSKPCGDLPIDEITRLVDIVNSIFAMINNVLVSKDPKLVVIENFAFMAKGNSLTKLAGLSYLVRVELLEQGVPFIMVAPTSLKKFLTGSGKGDKDQIMMSIYKNYGFEAKDNNEADSFGLAICGLAVLGLPVNKLTVPQVEVVNLLKKQL